MNDEILLAIDGCRLTAVVELGIVAIIKIQRNAILSTGKGPTVIQLGANLRWFEVTIMKTGGGIYSIYPANETTIAVAFITSKTAIKEAIIKKYSATSLVSNKATIGGITIDRAVKGNRRLAVVEVNTRIITKQTDYIATEFRARTDSTSNSQVFEHCTSNKAEGRRIFF